MKTVVAAYSAEPDLAAVVKKSTGVAGKLPNLVPNTPADALGAEDRKKSRGVRGDIALKKIAAKFG